MIKDIHTHLFPKEPGSALVCIGTDAGLLADCHPLSAGLHPWYVTGQDSRALSLLDSLAFDPRVLAIGECGFDRLKGASIDLQEKAFMYQFELSERASKPMILHVVREFDRILSLKKQLKPTQPWLIHGFRGGSVQAAQLMGAGFEISLGAQANPETVCSVPAGRLFLETDGKTDIESVIKRVSELRETGTDELTAVITRNVSLFLNI